ncbi:uncharacterized protein LOC112340704 [Selaginella moellendorffii]|uniref:uncharacterized protein LOC112340704 n=1 Tax=Selaginella moellendorffii TaxID=88036 RepID=UPI000D1C2983|nr:uncharacterized protein LOC112340704 [Selaginella moellendorffii]|eukprot:XP_024515315.1 uncharacterized protein LOC112340704 [Selaginella moellendorffii]
MPFEKWGIDFCGPFPPARRTGYKYVLVCTDYVTKWSEVKVLWEDTGKKVAEFFYEQIITRFGVPLELVSDRGTHFLNEAVAALTETYGVYHSKSTPYYPHCNGQVECTNGTLCQIVTKTCSASRMDWDKRLLDAVWAYQVALLPVELEVPALRMGVEHAMDWDGAIQQRLNELERLDEMRLLAFQAREALQKRRKKWHDDHIRERKFAIGDLVLLYDSKFWKWPGKLKIRWLGPYVVVNVNDNGSVQMADLSGNLLPMWINGF